VRVAALGAGAIHDNLVRRYPEVCGDRHAKHRCADQGSAPVCGSLERLDAGALTVVEHAEQIAVRRGECGPPDLKGHGYHLLVIRARGRLG
jgi:hypothetical protein